MKRFEVLLKPSALKDLRAIDRTYHEPIKARIRLLAEDPIQHDTEKLSGPESLYRIRKGKYRIVYSIDFKAGIVRVLAVDHRKDVYRNLDN
jgi:mRNA interferase RelE/StbE